MSTDYTSARSVLGTADLWSQFCDAWWSVSCVMREDFMPEPSEDERDDYEPVHVELGWPSAYHGVL